MNKNDMKNNKILNQNGQILLFVVIAMSVALAVGIAISSRAVSSLRRTAKTDTASRVFSAAEGGVEQFVLYPDYVLDSLNVDLVNTQAEFEAACTSLNYTPVTEGAKDEWACKFTYDATAGGDNIVAEALVTVRNFRLNDGDAYTFSTSNGNTSEIAMRNNYSDPGTTFNGNMDICWDNKDVYLYIMVYNESGFFKKEILEADPVSDGTEPRFDLQLDGNLRDAALNASRGKYCVNYTSSDFYSTDRAAGVRVRPLGGAAEVSVYPSGGTNQFPNQGYEIVSKGQLVQEGETKSIKIVRAYKTYGFMPGIFDNAIYSEGSITN